MNGRFRCRHCKKIKIKKTRIQKYCNDIECQKARRNTWRRQRYACDPDYRDNQRESTCSWLDKQGGAASYYRNYRKHRAKVKTSQAKSQDRTPPPSLPSSANSDGITQEKQSISKRCKLFLIDDHGNANSDALIAEIVINSSVCSLFANIDSADSAPRGLQ